MKDRIYVCHTYYHVYVAFLKELALPKEKQGGATLLLSTMSIDFTGLKERLEALHYFEDVLYYDEKKFEEFPELEKYKKDRGNIAVNMLYRCIFTKKFGRIAGQAVPVDMAAYGERYVFCDSDPIGYYLNYRRLPYHALEDGLNCLVHYDTARYDNRGSFELKAFLSKKCNLIFIQNGYGRYCLDMEVNSIAAIANPCPYYVELPRQTLVDRLTREDKDLLLSAFVPDKEALEEKLALCKNGGKTVLLLTEPLCDLVTRRRIFDDLIQEYSGDAVVFLKPHPRDVLDYRKEFPEVPQFDGKLPMEMLNFFEDIHFNQVIGVLTEMSGIKYADETRRLGPDFMDKYEEPSIHRQNEQI